MGSCCSRKSPDEDDNNILTDSQINGSAHQSPVVVGIHNYEAQGVQDLSFRKGERMRVKNDTEGYWLLVEHVMTGDEGYVPRNYVAYESSLQSEEWFFKNTSRIEAEEQLLSDEGQQGTFLIRPSKHDELDGYSLSIKIQKDDGGYQVVHYKINTLENEYYISKDNIFNSLEELVKEYSKKTYGICHVLKTPCKKATPPMLVRSPLHQWEILKSDICLSKSLGKGSFGEVFLATWKNQQEVAVKVIKENSISQQEFLKEVELMKKLEHKKLVQLYGVCSVDEPFYIVREYLQKGSLLSYLRKDKGTTLKLINLLSISYHVASAMEYLEQQQCVHRNLGARNVLLGQNNVAKVCDYGLVQIVKDGQHRVKSKSRFAIKWTAPEAIMKELFTVKSDVWSYGVFLMELFTYGETPYGNMDNEDVFELILKGWRMPKPKNYHLPNQIFETMQMCWHEDPSKRPTFESLAKYFKNIKIVENSGGLDVEKNILADVDWDYSVQKP